MADSKAKAIVNEWMKLHDVSLPTDAYITLCGLMETPPAKNVVTNADIDAVTLEFWGKQPGAFTAAYRAYARAILEQAK